MKTASQILKHEHEAIMIALNVLEKIAGRIRQNEEVDLEDIADMLLFLKEFADKCHHGKEEGILFPELEKVGIPNEHGPIGVMMAEHVQGRSFIRQMQESTEQQPFNNALFANSALSYVNLLRNHILKENNILFPMGDRQLSDALQIQLLSQFQEYEENVTGKEKHREFEAMLDSFQKKYFNL